MSDRHPCRTRPLDPAVKDRLAALARANHAAFEGIARTGSAAEPHGTRDDTAQIDRVTAAHHREIGTPPYDPRPVRHPCHFVRMAKPLAETAN